MGNKKDTQTNIKKPLFFISIITAVIAIILYIIFRYTGYKSLSLLVYTILLPITTNLVLILTKNNKKDESDDEHEEETSSSLKNFYNRFKNIIITLCVIAIIILFNILYWINFNNKIIDSKLTYALPVTIVFMWVIFLIMERYCRHIVENANKDNIENAFYLSIVQSLRGGLLIGMTALVCCFIFTFFSVMKIFDISKYLEIFINILFVYETIFITLSLIVRLIRKELDSTPELSIPMPGIGGKDLSIISYLENNTGMTMRSLWSMKLIKRAIPFSLCSIIVLLWTFSGVVKIDSQQLGAHYRFGKLQKEFLKPGIHLTLPWGIDDVEVYDTDVINKMTIGYSSEENVDNFWTSGHGGEEYKLLLGGGKEVVSINLRLEFKINNLKDYISGSKSPEMILQAAAYEAITMRTINTNIETLLSADRAQLSEELKTDIKRLISRYETGLEIVSVVLESIHPPIEVAEIYQEIISAGIKAESIILNAESTAAVTIANAKSDKIEKINMEKALAFESAAEAKAAVAEFMACVEADKEYPDDYRYQKYIKAMCKAYSNGKLIIVGEGVNEKNIYIGNLIVKEDKTESSK